jgi:hypothetical protein
MKKCESDDEGDKKDKPKKTTPLNLKKLTVVGMCHIGVVDQNMSQAFQSMDEDF